MGRADRLDMGIGSTVGSDGLGRLNRDFSRCNFVMGMHVRRKCSRSRVSTAASSCGGR
jgi:hypothetical protein